MKKRILGTAAVLSVALLLSGCSGNDTKFDFKGVKNVQEMIYFKYKNKVEVYCPTGICQFSISANKSTKLNVEMYYDKMKPFKKLEGINLEGDAKATIKRESDSTFALNLPDQNAPVKIQVIDYYRQ